MSATPADRVPGAVLTGFIGSGKIALLNQLLDEWHARRLAAARDGPATASASGQGAASAEERLSELDLGYVHFALRGDPIRILGALMRRRDSFDDALVETRGLAEPAPLVRALLDGDPSAQPWPSTVVAAVSALRVSLHLDPSTHGEEQDASADVVLLDLGSLRRARDDAIEEVLARPGRYREVREGLRVKEVVLGDGEARRRHVVCHVPAEEARQREQRASLLVGLEAELRALRTSEGATRERAPALLESGRYGRYLRETASGLRIDRAAIADAERHDGKWVVSSSDETLAVEDLALLHERLMRIEACWIELGSLLRSPPVRPLHPWPPQTHLAMSVLALLLERVIEGHASGAWRHLADSLHQIEVVEDQAARAAGPAGDERAAAPLASSA